MSAQRETLRRRNDSGRHERGMNVGRHEQCGVSGEGMKQGIIAIFG